MLYFIYSSFTNPSTLQHLCKNTKISYTLFVDIITAIIVGGNWSQILYATVIPHIELTSAFAMMFVAILGTTITPYLFVGQASEEAEDDVAKGKIKEISQGNNNSTSVTTQSKNRQPKISKNEVRVMKTDTAL